MIDQQLLALLEKSSIFKPTSRNFKVSIEINPPKKYKFWLPNCFSPDNS